MTTQDKSYGLRDSDSCGNYFCITIISKYFFLVRTTEFLSPAVMIYECYFLSDNMIIIGDEIEQQGANLPSGKNYADYFKFGKFQHVQFWLHHQKQFPKLWMYALQIASANPTEVSCESLFSQSGYASTSRNTRMKSINFECQTIIAHNLKKVYFDIEQAVNKYKKREKNNEWGDDDNYCDAMFYLDWEEDML